MKKQKRSFGTLKWSQWSQKKTYEQLRSRSIDGSCQMVRTGSQKMKKVNMFLNFWVETEISTRYCWHTIFDVFVSAEVLKVAISVPKINFWWNFDQKHFFWIFIILVFDFFVFFSTFIFWFFWHLQISLKKLFFDDDFLCFATKCWIFTGNFISANNSGS